MVAQKSHPITFCQSHKPSLIFDNLRGIPKRSLAPTSISVLGVVAPRVLTPGTASEFLTRKWLSYQVLAE